MALSRTTHTYTSGPRVFPLSFALGFLERSDVSVIVSGELDSMGNEIQRAFTFNSDTEITVTDPIPANSTVIISRTVNKEELPIDFEAAGSATREALQTSYRYIMMAVQEALDGRVVGAANNLPELIQQVLTARTQAQQAVTDAMQQRLIASRWAENPEDVEVMPGQFSALHWAAKARQNSTTLSNDPNPQLSAQLDANNNNIINVDNIGIGTNAPVGDGSTVHVHDGVNTDATLHLTNVTTGAGSADGMDLQAAGLDFLIRNREAGNMQFYTNNTVRVSITDAGRVGIGYPNPTSIFGVNGIMEFAGSGHVPPATAPFIFRRNSNDHLGFGNRGEVHMTIDENGNVIINKEALATNTVGIELRAPGEAVMTRSGGNPLEINRLANDGVLVNWRQAGNVEGSVTVSGSTVAYVGAHLARWFQLPGVDFTSKEDRPVILRGTVLTNLDEMCVWDDEDNEQLNKMEVSSVRADPNVSGVMQGWDDDDDEYLNDAYCAMTGDFVIRIAEGVVFKRGDLLMSAGDGTACPQEGELADVVRSYTVAKVTSTQVVHTYDDGSFLVPCVLMAC